MAAIRTVPPGYRLELGTDQLDMSRGR